MITDLGYFSSGYFLILLFRVTLGSSYEGFTMKIEITTKKSFYRLHSCKKWRSFYLWRYFKRKQARGQCWLIWSGIFGLFRISCYALNNRPL